MKRSGRTRLSKCLNCETKLKQDDAYCPKCGQKNSESQLSFRTLTADFFSNYFSLDSRFSRTIKPFFLKPGKLTLEFMEGKRVMYANPIRWYLVVSLIHFFVMSLVPNEKEEDNHFLVDGSSGDGGIIAFDTSGDETDTLTSNEPSWLPNGEEFELILSLSEDRKNSFTIICDSLQVDEMPTIKRFVTKQIIKLQLSEGETFKGYILKNIPILMFILLPIYALILKLFFRKRLYIHHLIHSFHLHSFLFATLTLYWLLAILLGAYVPVINGLTFVLLCYYIGVSFRKNYLITRTRTFFTVLGSGLSYSIALLIGLMLEILISLILF